MDLTAQAIDDRLALIKTRLGSLRALDPPRPGTSYRIGAGAGPGHGIYEFERMRKENGPECVRPFPEGDEGPVYADVDDNGGVVDGWMPIIEGGCGGCTGLITSGAYRGHVVDINFNEGGRWTIGPAFLDFYDEWLTESIDLLSNPRCP